MKNSMEDDAHGRFNGGLGKPVNSIPGAQEVPH